MICWVTHLLHRETLSNAFVYSLLNVNRNQNVRATNVVLNKTENGLYQLNYVRASKQLQLCFSFVYIDVLLPSVFLFWQKMPIRLSSPAVFLFVFVC